MEQTVFRPLLYLAAMGAALSLVSSTPAHAVPLLQLYVEGATYVGGGEDTWILDSSGGSFRLWAIGNVDGGGGKGPILGAKLSAVYDSDILDVVISLTPSTTLGFNGFTDPAAPITPTLLQTVDDGSTPLLGDGSSLPPHDEYGTGKTWQEFSIGNFDLTDSEIEDFITSAPMASGETEGQINVYDVSITSSSSEPFSVHFDLYNHYEAQNGFQYRFAPFSHDSEGDGSGDDEPAPGDIVPEPTSMLLLMVGSLGMAGYGYRRRKIELAS